jgi:predicted RNA-binding protein YlqC (UPF0109 family)
LADEDLVVEDVRTVFLTMVRCLVDKSDEVKLNTLRDGQAIVFQVIVDPSDVGKVIGKSGRHARALRTLLSAASVKYKQQFRMDIPADRD